MLPHCWCWSFMPTEANSSRRELVKGFKVVVETRSERGYLSGWYLCKDAFWLVKENWCMPGWDLLAIVVWWHFVCLPSLVLMGRTALSLCLVWRRWDHFRVVEWRLQEVTFVWFSVLVDLRFLIAISLLSCTLCKVATVSTPIMDQRPLSNTTLVQINGHTPSGRIPA